MKPKKRKESQQKGSGKSPIRQAISAATVVASRGASLGISVTDLYAADQKGPVRNEAAQQKDAASRAWGNTNATQLKISDQLKITEAAQLKFWNQIKGESRQRKMYVNRFKELQANEKKITGK
jgi:hypothetical protein